VGSHPLWAHYLLSLICAGIANERILNLTFNRWNAALALASFLDTNVGKYKDRHVLELGAGGALPSIVATKNGAGKV